jgi:hypothetical protein
MYFWEVRVGQVALCSQLLLLPLGVRPMLALASLSPVVSFGLSFPREGGLTLLSLPPN